MTDLTPFLAEIKEICLAGEPWSCVEDVLRRVHAAAKIAETDRGPDSFLGGYSVQDVQRFGGERIAAAIHAASAESA